MCRVHINFLSNGKLKQDNEKLFLNFYLLIPTCPYISFTCIRVMQSSKVVFYFMDILKISCFFLILSTNVVDNIELTSSPPLVMGFPTLIRINLLWATIRDDESTNY